MAPCTCLDLGTGKLRQQIETTGIKGGFSRIQDGDIYDITTTPMTLLPSASGPQSEDDGIQYVDHDPGLRCDDHSVQHLAQDVTKMTVIMS
ncbi:hypothetical protein O3M35_010462 [Rhynocoris fuscipes]|uniref:Uncharacterized protein n=1 Tax=Rhynocoris fuscipes TaxID=488301 RepID=A0AAW1D4D0_9HEMI